MLTLLNQGASPTTVNWDFSTVYLDWEKILDNGVTATSALSLMTFSSTLTGPDTGGFPRV